MGKTHLAVGLGLKAIEHGYRVLRTIAAALVAALTRALGESRLDDNRKVLLVPMWYATSSIGRRSMLYRARSSHLDMDRRVLSRPPDP